MSSKASGASRALSTIVDYCISVNLVFMSGTVIVRSRPLVDRATAVCILSGCFIVLVTIGRLLLRGKSFRLRQLSIIWLGATIIGFAWACFTSSNMRAALLAYLPVFASVVYVASLDGIGQVREIFRRLINVVCVLAVLSLFFFFLGDIAGIISPSGYVTFDWDWERTVPTYYGLHFDVQRSAALGYTGIRNTGIFTEAPMYNFVLCSALSINMLVLRERPLISALLALTVATTFSATGYVALVVMFSALLLVRPIHNKLLSALRYLVIPVLLTAGIVAIQLILENKTDTGVRSNHLLGCVQVFLETFPVGAGFGNGQLFTRAFNNDYGVSIGTMYLLARGGFPSLMLYLGPLLYGMAWGIKDRQWLYIASQLVFFWLWFLTQVVTNLLPWFLLLAFAVYPRFAFYESTKESRTEVDHWPTR